MATIHVSVSEETLGGLLCSAMEGGIGYWAQISSYRAPSAEALAAVHEEFREFRHIAYPLSADGHIVLRDTAAEVKNLHKLDRAALDRGLAVMAANYPRHFADVLDLNYDACTGDVFIQCALFGELVYG